MRDPAAVLNEILATVQPTPPGPVPLDRCAGLVLAEPIIAPFALPRFTNAAMDGYALRHRDLTTGAPLRVVGHSLAGDPWSTTIGPGEAVAIATGAAVPAGGDTVVPWEEVTVDGDVVALPHCGVEEGANVRTAGEDVAPGVVVVPAGAVMGPGQLAAAGAAGVVRVTVHPRPLVAIVPTGSEVRPTGATLGPADVYDAVSAPVAALAGELGAEVARYEPVPDDADAILSTLRQAAPTADLIITVGGVSAGNRDLVRTLNTAGRMQGHQLALRPARPLATGTMFGRPVLGLPGNPGAALVAFEVFARPVILRLLGRTVARRLPVVATLTERLTEDPHRAQVVRLRVWTEGGRLLAGPPGPPGSAMMGSLAATNAWAMVGPGAEGLPAGGPVEVELLCDPFSS